MKFSQEVWHKTNNVIEAIKQHPFNQELMLGILDREKFAYYIEQDVLYLNDFARCLAILASKAPMKYVRKFLQYAEGVFIVEQEIVHQYFKNEIKIKSTDNLSPAMLSYTAFLFKHCLHEPFEIGVAAILPCFWIYHEIGLYILQNSVNHNIYNRWIEAYASDDFKHSVNEVIELFDILAEKTSDETKEKMQKAFYMGACLEWHFWNDAYNKKAYEV